MLRTVGFFILLLVLYQRSYTQQVDTAYRKNPVLIWADGGLTGGGEPIRAAVTFGVHTQLRRVVLSYRNVSGQNQLFFLGPNPPPFASLVANNLLFGYRRYGRPWFWRVSGGLGYIKAVGYDINESAALHIEADAGVGFPLFGIGFLIYGNMNRTTSIVGVALTLQIGYIRRFYYKN